jgi:hypothetical protein
MNDFQIQIASPFDREHLVAEIWYKDDYFAEINQENGYFEIQLYYDDRTHIDLPLDEFIEILNKAKKRLIGQD